MRHWLASMPPSAARATWKAVDAGRVTGVAFAQREAASSDPSRALAGVTVHPGHRRQGTGAALWELVEAHLDAVGGLHVVAQGTDEEASARFCTARGFTRTSESETLRIDPRDLPAPPAIPQGVELVACAEYREDRETLFTADMLASADEPTDHDISAMPFALWDAFTFGHPDFDDTVSLVARVGGAIAGVTYLLVDVATSHATSVGTAVLPEHRGAGLATLLKRHSLARAAAAGVVCALTENDGTNAPMLAINRKLGYTRVAVGHGWTRDRTPSVHS
jgi:GNAT superfamily N-acetyltransferase